MLSCQDVHLSEKYIDIQQSKGPKSRRIFIGDELVLYLTCYDLLASSIFPERTCFFPRDAKSPYSAQSLSYNFAVVWKRAFPDWTGKLPRVYDWRHHFAWAAINRWAREGTDVNAMLPYLMRYMGHNCIKHTLYYFRFVPDFYQDYKDLSCRLNSFIDYLEQVEHTNRKKITLHSFDKETLKRYQAWMVEVRKLAPKTCNLRLTAIRSFLEYAAQEQLWVMPIYTDACTIVNVKTTNRQSNISNLMKCLRCWLPIREQQDGPA